MLRRLAASQSSRQQTLAIQLGNDYHVYTRKKSNGGGCVHLICVAAEAAVAGWISARSAASAASSSSTPSGRIVCGTCSGGVLSAIVLPRADSEVDGDILYTCRATPTVLESHATRTERATEH